MTAIACISGARSAHVHKAMALSVTSLALIVVGSAHGQVASAMVREGNTLPGDPSGLTIFSINTPAVNHAGGYAWQVNVGPSASLTSHIWGNATGGAGTVLRTEGTFGIYTQTGFEAFFGFSDVGVSCYSPTVTPGGDSVWADSTPVAVQGQPHPTLAGMFWSFGSRPGITASGVPYFSGGITTTAGGTTTNRGLFYGADGGTVLLMGGQTPPNIPRALTTSTSQPAFDYRMSADGAHFIGNVVMIAPTADDNAMILDGSGLMVDGTLVQEAHAIPAAAGGLAGENWAFFDFAGVTNSGDYFFTGDSNLVATADEFIFKNGQMLYRDGMVLDGQTLQGDIEAAYMNENGDIAYVWDVAANTLEALYLNDDLLLKEGDLVDLDNDGTVELNSVVVNIGGSAAVVVSDRAGGVVKVYFTADIDIFGTSSTTDDVEGAFVITVPVGECVADISPNGSVDVNDLLAVITTWGACPLPCPPNCDADISPPRGDCQVDVNDLLAVITTWGPCP